jgi:hypothetical protein
LKEVQHGAHALDSVKEEASGDNEELREAQNEFFTQLNVIQYYQYEIIILSDQIDEIKGPVHRDKACI